jgi:hypothetical protein
MVSRRNRQCFPTLCPGTRPLWASLYKVDLETFKYSASSSRVSTCSVNVFMRFSPASIRQYSNDLTPLVKRIVAVAGNCWSPKPGLGGYAVSRCTQRTWICRSSSTWSLVTHVCLASFSMAKCAVRLYRLGGVYERTYRSKRKEKGSR